MYRDAPYQPLSAAPSYICLFHLSFIPPSPLFPLPLPILNLPPFPFFLPSSFPCGIFCLGLGPFFSLVRKALLKALQRLGRCLLSTTLPFLFLRDYKCFLSSLPARPIPLRGNRLWARTPPKQTQGGSLLTPPPPDGRPGAFVRPVFFFHAFHGL